MVSSGENVKRRKLHETIWCHRTSTNNAEVTNIQHKTHELKRSLTERFRTCILKKMSICQVHLIKSWQHYLRKLASVSYTYLSSNDHNLCNLSLSAFSIHAEDAILVVTKIGTIITCRIYRFLAWHLYIFLNMKIEGKFWSDLCITPVFREVRRFLCVSTVL